MTERDFLFWMAVTCALLMWFALCVAIPGILGGLPAVVGTHIGVTAIAFIVAYARRNT